MEMSQFISYIKTKERVIFMKELYQGLNAAWNHMTREERIQYQADVLVNMCKENIRAREHKKEVDDQELFAEIISQLVKDEVVNAMKEPALKLYRKGMRKKEIAEILDVDPELVNAWIGSESRRSYGNPC